MDLAAVDDLWISHICPYKVHTYNCLCTVWAMKMTFSFALQITQINIKLCKRKNKILLSGLNQTANLDYWMEKWSEPDLHVSMPSFYGFLCESKHWHSVLLTCRYMAFRRASGTVCSFFTLQMHASIWWCLQNVTCNFLKRNMGKICECND